MCLVETGWSRTEDTPRNPWTWLDGQPVDKAPVEYWTILIGYLAVSRDGCYDLEQKPWRHSLSSGPCSKNYVLKCVNYFILKGDSFI